MVSRLGSVVLICAALAPFRAFAEDRWTEPYPGVRYLERVTTGPAERIFAVTVDLARPGVTLHATKRPDRGRTVTSFAGKYGVEVAVNGDFFNSDFTTRGLAMGAHEQWTGSSDNTRWSFVAVGDGNRMFIPLPEETSAAESWMSEIVGGYPLLVDQGAAIPFPDCTTDFCHRNPRTAVGLSQDGKTLIVVVIDGRSTRSVGMSLPEEAALMVNLGAWRALNLDGGGSSAMFVGAEGGVVNVPSDGTERKVGNHLGIAISAAPSVDAGVPVAPDAGVDAPPSPDAAAGIDAATVPPPAADSDLGGGCQVSDRDDDALIAALLLCAFLLGRRRLA